MLPRSATIAVAVVLLMLLSCSGPRNISEPRLVSAQWSGGLCAGPCYGSVSFDGPSVAMNAKVTGFGPVVERRVRARLTKQGVERLDAELSKVRIADHDTESTRKDLVDAGAASFVLVGSDGKRTRHSYYPSNEPPATLARLHEFVRRVQGHMRSCTDAPYVRVTRPCRPFNDPASWRDQANGG